MTKDLFSFCLQRVPTCHKLKTSLALCLSLWAFAGHAQQFSPGGEPTTDDTIELRDTDEGAMALFYDNHPSQGSNEGTFTRSRNGITVAVTIEILNEGPERITVEVIEPEGLVVLDDGPRDIPDGDSTTFILAWAMF